MKRLQILDCIRAMAILLVLFFHANIPGFNVSFGWIGVDLFFVLSGFLVSGLLFQDIKSGNGVSPYNFLIRRGLKIYPLFYFMLLVHGVYFMIKGTKISSGQWLSEFFFFQNYRQGVMSITWSLAVEEHFYLILVFFVFFCWKYCRVVISKLIIMGCLFVCVACLILRFYTYFKNGYSGVFVNVFPSHLRMDSLAFGVFFSYFYNFKKEAYSQFIRKWSWLLFISFFLFLLPITLVYRHSFFVITFGYTFIYLGLGFLIMLSVEYQAEIELKISSSRLFFLYRFLAWIGRNSYAIYLCHLLVGAGTANWVRKYLQPYNSEILILISYLFASIVIGVLLTYFIEKPFLRFRQYYFPSKTKA